MVTVKNLTIAKQSGSNTHYATWSFSGGTVVTSGSIKVGSLVTIKSGATYYNGVAIPSFVMNDKWYVVEVYGDRAVLGKNQSGTHNIQSPIKVSNLNGGSSGGGSVSLSTFDHYEVQWYYDTGDNIWFNGGSTTTKENQATYNAPENAIFIMVSVTPVSKKYRVNNTETSYWTGTKAQKKYAIASDPPEKLSAPSVTIDQYKLTALIENISDARADKVEFQVFNGTKLTNSGSVTVQTCRASFSCTVSAGGEYRVRCRAINLNGTSEIPGEWSAYSNSIKSVPSMPDAITVCKASSETSVYWSGLRLPAPIVTTSNIQPRSDILMARIKRLL